MNRRDDPLKTIVEHDLSAIRKLSLQHGSCLSALAG